MPERIATFRGSVACEAAERVPRLTLRGYARQGPALEGPVLGEPVLEGAVEPTALALSGATPAGLPATLEDVIVEHLGGTQYRIGAGTESWLVSASAVHLHREIAAQFYAAIPPRRAPRAKRLFWRAVLWLAATRAGLSLLRMVRR